MKKILPTITLLLAVALTLVVSRDLFSSNPKEEVATEMLDTPSAEEIILSNIMTRNSVRSYLDKPIEQDKVEKLLRAGMASPSAGNKQPWAFVVVNNKETLTKLGNALPYAKMTSDAPLAIVVCGDLSKGFEGIASEYWIQDCSAVSENILLAAHALGLGAVWTGVHPIKERVEFVSKELELPDHIVPLNVIPIGYPSGDTPVKDKWNPSSVRYNKW